jgi:hypothetical protein
MTSEYEQALEAFSEAVDGVVAARKQLHEAQSHLQLMEDAKARAWVRLQDVGRAVRKARAQGVAVPNDVLEDINRLYNKAARKEGR